MLSALSLNDQAGTPIVLHETTQRAVLSANGLVGIAAPRRSVRDRPTGHGSIDETRYVSEALVEIVGDVWGTTQELAYAQWRLIAAPMLATLDGNAALLKWTEGASGLQLQREIRLASAVEPALREASTVLRYQAIFAAQDPRAYSQTLTTATGAIYGSGGLVAAANAGNRPTPFIARLYGPSSGSITDPGLYGPLGQIKIAGSIPSGSYLELDSQARTLTMVVVATDVRTARQDLYNPALSRWFEIPAGGQSLQLTLATGTTTNARADVLTRAAYT